MADLLRDWLHLHLAVGVGPTTFHRLLSAFGDVGRALNASMGQLENVRGIGRATAEQIHQSLREIDPDEELAQAEAAGVEIVPFYDSRYPKALAAIPDPPSVLYVRGRLGEQDALSLALVGSRRCSRYGWEQSRRFGYLLGQAGFTIVSGLARGIDAAAHEGALAARGRTVAVLGCGLGHIYPAEHAELAMRIVESGGAVVSELPMNITPNAGNFPQRNRIIAGWSLGTLVVEAPSRSGALITARLATEYNREVFAVPGQIDKPASGGANAMIRDGQAKLVTCVEDVLDELGPVGETLKSGPSGTPSPDSLFDSPEDTAIRADLEKSLTEPERQVWRLLETGPLDVDALCQQSGLNVPAVNGALTSLQLKGMIKSLPGNQFCRR